MKKSMTKMAMVMVLLLSMLAGMVCVAHADTPTPTPTGALEYMNKDDGENVLESQTTSFQKLAGSIYKFLLLALNSICAIALIVIGIMAVFSIGEPQTKQKMKSAALTIVVILIIGNGAINIVYWGIRLAQNIF